MTGLVGLGGWPQHDHDWNFCNGLGGRKGGRDLAQRPRRLARRVSFRDRGVLKSASRPRAARPRRRPSRATRFCSSVSCCGPRGNPITAPSHIVITSDPGYQTEIRWVGERAGNGRPLTSKPPKCRRYAISRRHQPPLGRPGAGRRKERKGPPICGSYATRVERHHTNRPGEGGKKGNRWIRCG